MTDVSLTWIQGEQQVARWLPELTRTIEPALEVDGLTDLEDLLQDLREAEACALLAWAPGILYGTCVVRVVDYPLARVMEVITAGGHDSEVWMDVMHEAIKRYATEQSCSTIRAYCRPGLAKWLRPYGWRTKLEVMERSNVH